MKRSMITVLTVVMVVGLAATAAQAATLTLTGNAASDGWTLIGNSKDAGISVSPQPYSFLSAHLGRHFFELFPGHEAAQGWRRFAPREIVGVVTRRGNVRLARRALSKKSYVNCH